MQKYWLYFLLLLASHNSFSQNSYSDISFLYQVKVLDEFIERFNGDTSTLINEFAKGQGYHSPIDRSILLINLFNKSDSVFGISAYNPNIKPFDSAYLANHTIIGETMVANYIADFMQYVLCNPVKSIDYYDDNWFCKVTYYFEYQGKTLPAEFILYNEKNESNKTSKWAIRSVKASFLNIDQKSDSSLFWHPASHDTNFMRLTSALNSPELFANYFFSGYSQEPLTVFLHMLSQNEIKPVNRGNISYYFLQLAPWVFKVDYFQRDTNNSGWLISFLKKMDADELHHYKDQELNIRTTK